ncbi:hypothetical protein [Luteococcus sp. OSA5]|uniref:hypothetical protein n=1 Tax=Luteococcus sp. OSA5 TaxID=3401630 RepID=UPI003B438C9E
MTDEHNPQPRPDGAQDEPIVGTGPQVPEGDTDPTAAAKQSEPTQPEVDHSAWMRPAVGEDVRTSEVVGALAPEPTEPEDLPEDPVDVFDEAAPVTPEESDQEGSGPADQTAPMAASVGARAALQREDESGVDLAPTAPRHGEQDKRGGFLRWLPWLIGAVVLALIAFAVVFQQTRKPVVVVTPTPTPSVTKPPVVVNADLMAAKDAELIAKGEGWTAAETLQKLSPTSRRIFCQNSSTGQPNPTQTKQRTLTTKSETPIVARHQIDNYATAADATTTYKLRAENMAKCDDVPTYIYSGTGVSGIGDEAQLMTVVFEDVIPEYHTLLLVRTGTTVHSYDVIQAKKPVSALAVAKAAGETINRQCSRAKGTCAKDPKTAAAIPPPAGTPGWMVISDLPRVSPGAGLWSATEVGNVSTKGSQCENMTLASEAGPTKREQRTYLMTQDNAAPQTFGVDEVILTFKDDQAAAKFAEKLTGNLNKCPDRQETATVSEPATVEGKAGKTDIKADTLLVEQAMGGEETARFRTATVQAGNQVVFLTNNPSASYDLGGKKFGQIALRAGQRATQGD